METTASELLSNAMRSVDEFFDGVFVPLGMWRANLVQRLAERLERGQMTGSQIAEFVRLEVEGVLSSQTRPLHGAGFCASEAVVCGDNPLAWWRSADRTPLGNPAFGPGQSAIDLSRLEWYRVPRDSGERHITGPFVDYLCSNQLTLTFTKPVLLGDQFCGVVWADVLVADLERELLHWGLDTVAATLVNEAGRVVVSSDPAYEAGERYPGADPEIGVLSLIETGRVVSSTRYPFSLIASSNYSR